MTYTIAEAARRCGLSAHTLRYYDKEGLMPYVDRSPAGVRLFKDSDFEWLNLITCLKDSGVPIKQIKQFIDWSIAGDSTIEDRLAFLRAHKENVKRQMADLERHLETIDYKIWYYEKAKEAGTTAIHNQDAS